jgi:radical SAM protein (TIGR04043 family)
MPGKSSVTLDEYRAAWREGIRVFGRNQVSTYLLVGLGEDADELVESVEELIRLGVYPFVVPFRPLTGTLATDVDGATAPDPAVVSTVTARVARRLRAEGMVGSEQKAGCAACGACSALACEGA